MWKGNWQSGTHERSAPQMHTADGVSVGVGRGGRTARALCERGFEKQRGQARQGQGSQGLRKAERNGTNDRRLCCQMGLCTKDISALRVVGHDWAVQVLRFHSLGPDWMQLSRLVAGATLRIQRLVGIFHAPETHLDLLIVQ